MRHVLRLLVILQVAVFAGCAMKPFPPPQIVGRVKSVSDHDIQIVTMIAERQMREDIGWAVPITQIEVRDHDHFTVTYSYGEHTWQLPVTRGSRRLGH